MSITFEYDGFDITFTQWLGLARNIDMGMLLGNLTFLFFILCFVSQLNFHGTIIITYQVLHVDTALR